MKPPETRDTSPLTPPFLEEPWRSERRMTPEEVAPYLAELRAVVAKAQATARAREEVIHHDQAAAAGSTEAAAAEDRREDVTDSRGSHAHPVGAPAAHHPVPF